MTTTIRTSTFETNSSSVHAIVFSPEYQMSELSMPITTGEFGWHGKLSSPQERLQYLWTGIQNYFYDPITVGTWQQFLAEELGLDLEAFRSDGGYVDHPEGLGELFQAFSEDPELLRACVFGDGYIMLGNDNTDGENPREHLGLDWKSDEKLITQRGQYVYIKGN